METLSSLWRRTGGMSENDAGVDATRFLCSSGEMNLGSASMSTIAMFCVARLCFTVQDSGGTDELQRPADLRTSAIEI